MGCAKFGAAATPGPGMVRNKNPPQTESRPVHVTRTNHDYEKLFPIVPYLYRLNEGWECFV